MKNKKGFLLGEETLKVVIAVICIAFLVYLLVAVYFSVTGNQKMKEAGASINNLISTEIERINNGGTSNTEGILIPNPSDWYIFSFVGDDKKPNSCIEQNCLCICEESFPDMFDWQLKRCDDKGICINVANLEKFERIKIDKAGVQLSIQKVNDKLEIKQK
jgi:hypothetical protein